MFIICLLALLLNHPTDTRWVVLNGCKLRISGATNVNKFGCEVTDYSSSDTLVLYNNLTMAGSISLDICQFSCANELMTKDLRRTLKAKEYPRMKIRFHSLGKVPCRQLQQEQVNGTVVIELAGVVKQFNILYFFSKDEQQTITLTGKQQVSFSDFGLTPPRKLGGMVQAKDRLDVLFCLKLKPIN